jgi:hypothetical protein
MSLYLEIILILVPLADRGGLAIVKFKYGIGLEQLISSNRQ